jgi:hypothetical protein
MTFQLVGSRGRPEGCPPSQARRLTSSSRHATEDSLTLTRLQTLSASSNRHQALRESWESDDWLTPDLFRFGASTLVNDVQMQIVKTVDRNYQSAAYFSLP